MSDLWLFIDKFKLAQVVRNFVSNALKFTPQGGSVTVYIYSTTKDEEINDPEVDVVFTITATLAPTLTPAQ